MEPIVSDTSVCPTPSGVRQKATLVSSKKRLTKGETFGRKLNEEQKKFLCNCIAEFKKSPDIILALKEKYKVTIHPSLISSYKNSKLWHEFIKKRREYYLLRLDDVAISHKRVRIEMIERIANRNDGTKDNVALNALTEARKEMEGDGVGGNVNYTNIAVQYNSMSDEEIKKQQERLMGYFKRQGKLIDIKPTEVTDGNV